ncbi:enoyl-CoA hydratase/isomerase family protein [Ketobacter sp.]|uniref:enoyl-CoA hydratase/isomerase family protein n=1 Tax=Ketobacter sp. TaxID=2083498 RepID=UPI000F118DAB|nr:enoyl-CoA hydratase-related protein [Ketobacter sp.]RLT93532.1 MAG: enoyl-CoA hydratase/isomerase family protein [Ketobacter sp.]
MMYETLLVEQQDCALLVQLNRPQARNAMSLAMVNELNHVFDRATNDPSIRALVLRGVDGHFCSGGDIKDMAGARAQAQAQTQAAQHGSDTEDAFYTLNRAFGRMITRADNVPCVLITVLEGAVLGGGFGLACVSDVAIAAHSAQFGLPETGLGVVPAQIAPFVVTRVGLTQARRLALLGERFDGEEAVRLGIAHYLCDSKQAIDDTLENVLTKVRRAAPHANRVTKQLLHQVGSMEMDSLLDGAAREFATAVKSDEGAEGTLAFVEKRLPNWAQ